MSLTDFVSLLISAILLGGLYATMSYGLALIYGVMKIVNIAHAGFMMLGAYAAYILIQPGYAEPAHDWRARHGGSYGPCRIVIRPEGPE